MQNEYFEYVAILIKLILLSWGYCVFFNSKYLIENKTEHIYIFKILYLSAERTLAFISGKYSNI